MSIKWSPGCNCCETVTCDLFDLDITLPLDSQDFATDYTGDYPLCTRERGKLTHDSTLNQVTLEPPSGYTGYDKMGFTVSDNDGNSGVAELWIYVNDSSGTPPTADPASDTASENGSAISIDLSPLVTNAMSCSVQTTPLKGSAVMNGNFILEYTPAADENGRDAFFYRANGSDGNAFGIVEITITPTSSANPDTFTLQAYYAETDDATNLTIDEADLLDIAFGASPFTFGEIRSPNAEGYWLLAGKYIEGNATMPTTGARIKTHGPSNGGGGYEKLSDDVEIEIRDTTPATIAKLERTGDEAMTITADGGSLALDFTHYSLGFGRTVIPAGELSSSSLFHEMVITNTAVQSRRDNSKDATFPYSTVFADDGTTRARKTDFGLAHSHRMTNDIPAGSKARITNTGLSDVLVGDFVGDKVADTLAPKNSTCDEGRAVCQVVEDNHMQRWSGSASYDGGSFEAAEFRTSENCQYSEQGPEYAGGIVTDGYIRQDWTRDRYFYTWCGQLGNRSLDKLAKDGTATITDPSLAANADHAHALSVVPTDIGGGMVRLTITLTFSTFGVVWDGTNLNGSPPAAQLTVTQTGDTLEIVKNVNDNQYTWNTSTVAGPSTGPAGNTLLGFCNNPGGTTDDFTTEEFVRTDRTTQRYEAPLVMVDGYATVEMVWTEDVPVWSDSSPTLNLSGADATITITTNHGTSSDLFRFDSVSTTTNTNSFTSGTDQYTPFTANPTDSASCDVVNQPGSSCPAATGSAIDNSAWDIDITHNYTKPDFTTLTLTLTGST